MYDQVKKSWAKQSVALDVSQYLCPNHMLKSPNFMREKKPLLWALISQFLIIYSLGFNYSRVMGLALMKARPTLNNAHMLTILHAILGSARIP